MFARPARRRRGRTLTDQARATLGRIALAFGSLLVIAAGLGLAERLNLIAP